MRIFGPDQSKNQFQGDNILLNPMAGFLARGNYTIGYNNTIFNPKYFIAKFAPDITSFAFLIH